ncbi:unnamed protein product [Closterium sp. NIES-53]
MLSCRRLLHPLFLTFHGPESDRVRAVTQTVTQTVTRFLATVVTDLSFESAAASTLVAELVDFAALCRLDCAASLVFYSACPLSIGGELALSCDVLEDRQFELECLAVTTPHLASTPLCPEGDPDALDIPTSRSYADAITGAYVDTVPPPGAKIVDGMWIFWVKRPSGSPPTFKARHVARGFSQREGVDFFQTFSPTPKMITLRGSLHEEIRLRRPRGFTGSFPEGTQWSLRRPEFGLRHAPHTSLPPFYVLVYVENLVFATADTEALALVKAELQERHTCTDLAHIPTSLAPSSPAPSSPSLSSRSPTSPAPSSPSPAPSIPPPCPPTPRPARTTPRLPCLPLPPSPSPPSPSSPSSPNCRSRACLSNRVEVTWCRL